MAKRHARQVATLTDLLVEASNLGEIDELSDAGADSEARAILALLHGLELHSLLETTADAPALVDAYLDTALQRGPSPDVNHASASLT